MGGRQTLVSGEAAALCCHEQRHSLLRLCSRPEEAQRAHSLARSARDFAAPPPCSFVCFSVRLFVGGLLLSLPLPPLLLAPITGLPASSLRTRRLDEPRGETRSGTRGDAESRLVCRRERQFNSLHSTSSALLLCQF